MRKALGFLPFAGLAALAAAHLAPAVLGDFAKALQGAQTLKTSYTVQMIGGAPDRYSVELKKPNLLHIETPTQTLVSDGKDLTTYDKAEGTYFLQPVTNDVVAQAFSAEPLNLWSGFFNPKALSPVSSRSLGTKSRGGLALDAVEATYDSKGQRVVTYFLDSTDKVARQAQIDLTRSGTKTTLIVNAKDLQLNAPLASDAFAFKAPSNSREVTQEEATAPKWLTDLDEAKAMAAKTGKRIFVDFMATWCGPCKLLDAQVLQTERFKSVARKSFVLLRIDVDAQKSVASMYNIEAMPTQMVLAKDGSVIAKTVGYGDPDTFYAFLLPNAA